jgi:hypothetical protein
MLNEGATPVTGTETGGTADTVDKRRGVELVKGGSVVEVERSDGSVATIYYTEDAEQAQTAPFPRYKTTGDGKLEKDWEGRQHHTRQIPPATYDRDKGSI